MFNIFTMFQDGEALFGKQFDSEGRYTGFREIEEPDYTGMSLSEKTAAQFRYNAEKRRQKMQMKPYKGLMKDLEKDYGFEETDFAELMEAIRDDPDEIIGGKDFLPTHDLEYSRKGYKVEGDVKQFIKRVKQYASEQKRLFSAAQTQQAEAMTSDKTARMQQEFDKQKIQLEASSVDRDMMADKQRQESKSDQYLDSLQAGTAAKNVSKKSSMGVIIPQDRPM